MYKITKYHNIRDKTMWALNHTGIAIKLGNFRTLFDIQTHTNNKKGTIICETTKYYMQYYKKPEATRHYEQMILEWHLYLFQRQQILEKKKNYPST